MTSPIDDLAFMVRNVLDQKNVLGACRNVEPDEFFNTGEICVTMSCSAKRSVMAAFRGTGLIVIDRGPGTKVWVKRA